MASVYRLSEKSRRLINKFESTTRGHEMRGYAAPESFQEIDDAFFNAKLALQAHIECLEAIVASKSQEASNNDQ